MTRLVPFFALALSLVVVSAACADNCRRTAPVNVYHAPVVRHQTVYHDPHAYHHDYYPHYPFANYTLFGLDPYDRIPALTDAVNKLQATIAAGRQPSAPTTPMPPATPTPQASPPVGSKAGAKAKASSQPPKVVAYIAANCASCHGPVSPKKGLTLVNDNGELADLDEMQRMKVHFRVSLGEKDKLTMPPKGEKPDDATFEELTEWCKGK